MQMHPAEQVGEIRELQRCINNVVSVLALPAIWSDSEPRRILKTLLDALLEMLHLDLLYANVTIEPETPIEIERYSRAGQHPAAVAEMRGALDAWLRAQSGDASAAPSTAPHPQSMSFLAMPLGVEGGLGLVVAGSRRQAFPEPTEKLVLNVAANQAAIGLQQAQLLSGEKRIARELDARVTQRTAELAAANEVLRKEIAERMQIEHRLRESETLLKKSEAKLWQVIDTIPIIAWCNLPDGPNEFLNKRWNEYTGMTSEESHGWGWTAAMHPDDLPVLMKKWSAAMASGQADQVEGRFRRHDGVYRWFLIRAEPFRDESNRVVRWYGTSTDIDDRRRAEEAILANERNLDLIINTMPVLAWSARPDGYVDFFNQRWLDYTGLAREQAHGWGWARAFHPDDLPRLNAYWTSIIASGQAGEMEARFGRSDGTYRWFLIRAHPLRDEAGAIVKWYGTNTDIDDRKRAEEELRRNEEFLTKAQQIASSGCFSWCVDTDEVTFSDGAYRIFGLESNSPLGEDVLRGRIHPEDLPLLTERVRRARSAGGDEDYEIRLQMPDGSVKHLHTTSSETRDFQGRRQYIGAIQDITQRRLADEALSKARSDLAHVSRVMSLNAFTASLAHEINQPLSGIVTNAGTCLRMLDASPPNIEGARETARRAIRDGNRASDVITRLRALFSRKDVKAEPLHFNEIVREVVALLLAELQQNRIVLSLYLDDRLPVVQGDRVQLQQVILNLLRNASDAMAHVENRPRELVLKTESDGRQVQLLVKDSGVGFDSAAADRLFDSFYTTKQDGMGIGLSVSRSIIEAHHGRLWAASNNGPGAIFGLSIPASTAANLTEKQPSL